MEPQFDKLLETPDWPKPSATIFGERQSEETTSEGGTWHSTANTHLRHCFRIDKGLPHTNSGSHGRILTTADETQLDAAQPTSNLESVSRRA